MKAGDHILHTVDPRMREVLRLAETVASSRAAVLISGESGTGKELLARFIHTKSLRAHHRFMAINCAAVPEGLLESELFGHEKGAFTGAIQAKIGKFELANGSTFLLDEVSEMPLLLQAKLLRVLQEGEVERVGGSQALRVNVRVIATTNRDLHQMVQEGRFRDDLFYRLNVIPLEVPSLRERLRDIEYLAGLFVNESCRQNGRPAKWLSAEAIAHLKSWSWPGNVRELQNTIERTVLLTPSEQIEARDLRISGFDREKTQLAFEAGMTLGQAERLLILKTLEHTQFNRTRAARMLGISIRTLRNKLQEYGREETR